MRVGLWYANLNFVPKEYQFEKQLHVDNRIGKADRSLIIYPYRSFKSLVGLSITGTSNIAFIDMPSAFALRINKVVLLNISTDFLISRRLGHYFPKEIEFKNELKRLSVGNVTKRDKVENSPFRVPLIDNPHVFSQVCYSKNFYDTLLSDIKIKGLKFCERTGTYKSSIYYSINNKTVELEQPKKIVLDYRNDSCKTDNYQKLSLIFDLFAYAINNLKGYNEGSSILIKELKKQKKISPRILILYM